MADIGRILALPPPVVSGRANAIPLDATETRTRQTDSRDLVAAVERDSDDANAARAKSFRFRVYDGGRADEALAGDNGVPSRSAGTARSDEAETERVRSGGEAPRAAGTAGATLATPSAPFLAQLIAQEQLRPGLYDPPLRSADRAYRQAGGQPALEDSRATGRFQIAV
ncbi:hypothetical protein [Dongia sp.]|uniref:hypothetical protein n=1 Tax=Dongia sp. TaxID=1977262 RepID=UPI0035B453F6